MGAARAGSGTRPRGQTRTGEAAVGVGEPRGGRGAVGGLDLGLGDVDDEIGGDEEGHAALERVGLVEPEGLALAAAQPAALRRLAGDGGAHRGV